MKTEVNHPLELKRPEARIVGLLPPFHEIDKTPSYSNEYAVLISVYLILNQLKIFVIY